MRAVVLSELGGPEKLRYSEAEPLPKLREDEVLVKNTFAGINYVDIYYRTGVYPIGKFPTIIGQEAAGVIVATLGSNPLGLKVGDRVVWIGQGGYAEYAAVHFGQCVKVPPGVTDEEATSFFLMGMTALSLVRGAYAVKKGQVVLLHAAAGGVGLLMCQILKAIGAVIIGTAGSSEKCARARDHGATYTIDYKASPGRAWVELVKDITKGQGVDVVYDSVGKDTWQGSMDVVKRNGKVVFFGAASGPIPDITMQKLGEKNVSVMRSALKNMIATRPELEMYANAALGLKKDGQVQVQIHKVYSLEDIAVAHEELEGRKTIGKLMVKL